MKYIRLYTGKDNQSHFEEASLSADDTEYGLLTTPFASPKVYFGEIDASKEIPWHNPPAPQYVIMLQGSVEIETGDGTKKIFKEGDVMLAEDTSGQGHKTRAVTTGMLKYLVLVK